MKLFSDLIFISSEKSENLRQFCLTRKLCFPPKAEDIKTPFEADIKDQIICCYHESDPEFDSFENNKTVIFHQFQFLSS